MRWVKFPDIRDNKAFENCNALRLYTWMLLACNDSRNLRLSFSYCAKVIHASRDCARYAVEILEREGLITRSGNIYTVETVDGLQALISDPLPALRSKWGAMQELTKASAAELSADVREFVKLETLTGKRWKNADDVFSHFINWRNKRRKPPREEQKKRVALGRGEIEEEEKKRAKEWEERAAASVSYEEFKEMQKKGDFPAP